MINILVVSLMLELNNKEYLSKINGIYLLIISLLTPVLNNYNSDNIKYDNNYLWGLSNTIVLISSYIFNDYYYKHNWRYVGIYAVIIPTLHMYLTKNPSMWLKMRIYSIFLTFIIQAFNPLIHSKLVTNINKKFLPSTNHFDNIKFLFLIISGYFIYLLIKQGYKNTFLDLVLTLLFSKKLKR